MTNENSQATPGTSPAPSDVQRREIIERAHAVVSAKDDITEAANLAGELALALMRARTKVEQGASFDGRRGRYIKTVGGTKFYILDPKPDDVKIRDMAHHLALKTRWGGSCQTLYTVGQHVLRVQEIIAWVFENAPEWGPFANVPREHWVLAGAYGLLHDGHEYVLPDVPRPIKAMLLGWDAIVAPLDIAIFASLGLGPMPPEIEAVVSWADDFALITEAEAIGPTGIMDVLTEQVSTPPGALEAFSALVGDPTWQEVEAALMHALERVAQTFGGNRNAVIAPEDRPPAPSETKAWKGEIASTESEAASTDKWAKLLGEGQ